MTNNYFLCVVCGKNSFANDREGRTKFLNRCIDDKAFYLEWNHSDGALSQVNVGDIVFLSVRQYVVAYGEVTNIQRENVSGGEFKRAIYVKDWIGPKKNHEQGVFLRGNILNFSAAHTASSCKIKKITNDDGANRVISQLRQKSI